ncbi:MAG: DUF2490 domain-containing protein [Sphingomonadales bacterium]|nr:DUF2490 domain-containing protein [Sphingomonadaceae bacterium]MBS3929768.1 DUF2490 domain-containing protein [Sphingomonadales bacterium]
MRSLTKSIAIAMLCGASSPAVASDDAAYWQNLNLSVKVSDEVRISSETSFRSSDARGFYQLQQVLMVGYKVSKNVTVSAGYVHAPNYSHGDFTSMERRFRQQLNMDNLAKIGPFSLSGRVRLEQRFRDDRSGTGWRVRPQIKAVAPLFGKVKINLASEPYFNLNTTSFQTVDGLDRIRNSATFTAPLGKKLGIEIGYMNQNAFVSNGPDRVDHVIMTGLSASF